MSLSNLIISWEIPPCPRIFWLKSLLWRQDSCLFYMKALKMGNYMESVLQFEWEKQSLPQYKHFKNVHWKTVLEA